MRWIKKWWGLLAIIILAVALVIGWEEERCQAQAYQCRASYAAQSQSERVAAPLSVYQQATEQQAIAAACEPNGYFCRFFGAANLPAVFLVIIGIGAVCAALWTLKAIERQTVALRRQEVAMRRQTRIIGDTARRQLRAYVSISSAMLKFHGRTEFFEAQVHAENKGQTPAYNVDHRINIWIGPHDAKFSDIPQPGNLGVKSSSLMLGPTQETILTKLRDESAVAPIGNLQKTVFVYGIVTYEDAFRQERYTRFCLVYGGIDSGRKTVKDGQIWGLLQSHSEGNDGN